MPEISISRKHGLCEADVRARIEELAEKISDRLRGSWSWQGDQAICLAHGARAQVGYDAESILIEVSLPPKMRPLSDRLEAKIIEYFDRSFAHPSCR